MAGAKVSDSSVTSDDSYRRSRYQRTQTTPVTPEEFKKAEQVKKAIEEVGKLLLYKYIYVYMYVYTSTLNS